MKLRIKFKKYDNMKFIGHLDLLRYFQKSINRAGIDIAYSEGFSPHQIMSFAAPLGVGIVSDAEYCDIEVKSVTSSEKMTADLNEVMVDGVEIVSVGMLDDKIKNAMAVVANADYEVYCKDNYLCDVSTDKISDFWAQKEINIFKKTKKSAKVVDIKPMINKISKISEEKVFLSLKTGSVANLKPELVMEALWMFCKGIVVEKAEVVESSQEISQQDPVQNKKDKYKKGFKKDSKTEMEDIWPHMPKNCILICRKEIYDEDMSPLEKAGRVF